LSGLFGVFGLHLEAASGNITGSVNKLAKAYNAFLFFCSSVGAEASFLSFFGFRHLPKTCFPDFHSVGGCRNVVFY